jgi:hypothetical protein
LNCTEARTGQDDCPYGDLNWLSSSRSSVSSSQPSES